MLNSVSARYFGWRYPTLHARLHHLKSRVTQTNIGILIVHSKKQIAPVISFRNSQGELVRGTITDLQRRTLVMEIYNPYSIVQVSEILTALTVKAGTADVYCGRAVVTSLVSTGLTAVVSVVLADEWRELSALTTTDAAAFGSEARLFIKDWDERCRVREDYQFAVNELRAFLTEVSRWVAQVDLASGLPGESEFLSDSTFYELAEPILKRARLYFDELECIASQISSESSSAHRVYAQSALHPLLLRSPFIYRTYTKPLGYAGDYQMVNQILDNRRQGPNTYFQMINSGFLEGHLAQAHRNRIDILYEFLERLANSALKEGKKKRVLNVGCGPAVEIQRFIREFHTPDVLEFVLVDFNEETLGHAKEKIKDATLHRKVGVVVDYSHQSVHDLIKRNINVLADAAFDAVYCAGLFDYLSDKVCNRLLAYFSSQSKRGGKVIFTNVHSKNPDRHFIMDHILEWFLIYRNESDMMRVSDRAGMRVARTYLDRTGVNVFVEAEIMNG